mmetsp:Transcript_16402/g.24620  ORF Transcript_16402/g.24620 Transcript_16402/m.24620 type:complete len:582 (+) Transcript_16402:142-1887(+)
MIDANNIMESGHQRTRSKQFSNGSLETLPEHREHRGLVVTNCNSSDYCRGRSPMSLQEVDSSKKGSDGNDNSQSSNTGVAGGPGGQNKAHADASSWLGRSLCSQPSLDDVSDDSRPCIESRSDCESYCRVSRREGVESNGALVSRELFRIEIDEMVDDQIELRPSTSSSSSSDDEDEEGVTSSLDNNYFNNNSERGLSVIMNEEEKCTTVMYNFLDGNKYMACSGQWYTYDSDELQLESESNNECVQVPRNRSRNPAERKKRIEQLQLNLTPFAVDELMFMKGSINTEKYSPVELNKRSRSFTVPSPVSVATTPPLARNFQCYNYSEFNLPQCGNKGAALIDWDESEEDDVCYDSDPSEFLQTKAQRQDINQQVQALSQRPYGRISASNDYDNLPPLMSSKMLLIWHRPQTATIQTIQSSSSQTISVRAWIEHGSYIQAGLIQPKFMWQENLGMENRRDERPHHHHHHANNRSRSILNTMAFHTVDLLDISKVVPLEHVDRTYFPFAKKSCCFVIQSYDREMLFEAETVEERNEIIHDLKLLVARLGSKIIVGDRGVLNEFFSPAGSVPGEAPGILKNGSL